MFVIGKVAMGELLREHSALAEQIAETWRARRAARPAHAGDDEWRHKRCCQHPAEAHPGFLRNRLSQSMKCQPLGRGLIVNQPMKPDDASLGKTIIIQRAMMLRIKSPEPINVQLY